jgi:hypothetical protein
MSYTARHGRDARIYIDATSAGTQAVGTSTLTLIEGKNTWAFDQSTDFVDTTSFGDTSKTNVAGLPSASGDINGILSTTGTGTLLYNVIGATTERGIMIFPSWTNDLTQYISGKAFFSAKSGGSTTSAVTLDLHFEAGPTGMTWTHP